MLSELKLHPIEMGFGLPVYRMGNPSIATDNVALEEVIGLSAPYGTQFKIENGIAVLQ